MLKARDVLTFARTASTILLALCLAPASRPAGATVFEYDAKGETTVSRGDVNKPRKPSQRNGLKHSQLRNLTREVAIRYSGTIGVRKAGLSALSFVQVFEALIERESAFNPIAVSPKGAKGLGQLMPGTAVDMGVADPFDPEANLNGSAKYLTLLLAEFGNLELALAAYNAGPTRVRRYGGVPPFAETRAYIAWIFKTAGVEREPTKPVKASVTASNPNNNEPPLNGDVSVWEF